MSNDKHIQQVNKHLLELRTEILKQGTTHQVMADRTGFRQQHISRMLSGKYIPRYDNFLALCDAAGFIVSLKRKRK